MLLWWIGNAVLLVVILPVVVLLLQGVVQPASEIKRTADQLASAGPVLVNYLDPVPQLTTTRQLVHQTTDGLARYGAALDRIL
ncbi:MAG TPA: hypothetical protein VIJ33_10470 [Solirubrobacteraceae bacterium]